MTFWWCVVVLALAVASAQYVEDDLSGDVDQVDTEVVESRWSGGSARRSCSTWCGCSGSIRSSYCCPTSYSTCETDLPVDPPNAGVICSGSICYERGPIVLPGYTGHRLCRGSTCYRRGPRLVLTGDLCMSRMCHVLRPRPTIDGGHPLGHTCSSHVECGDNVCCDNRCATIETCIAWRRTGTYPYVQSQPNGAHSQSPGHRCRSDMNCSSYGTNYICCNGQCTTRSGCNPGGVLDLLERF